MPTKIIDTNRNTTSRLAALKALGIDTVIRYLTPNFAGEKAIEAPEAHALAAAGVKLGLVFEVYGGVGGFIYHDINAASGKSHAEFVLDYAPKVGAPAGAVIYFAIDTDASASQINRLVLPYFSVVEAVMAGRYRVGVYGSGAVCTAVRAAGLAHKAWLSQSMGWMHSRTYRGSNLWDLLQGPVTMIGGLDTDPNEVNRARPDVGFFVPFSGVLAPTPPPIDPASVYLQETKENFEILQAKLNRLGLATPPLGVDGDFGPKTLTAVMAAVDKLLGS